MHFSPGRSAWTIFGWTPGLRYLVEGRVLACGCVVGLYEMWDRSLVEMVDSAVDTCDVGHDVNQVLMIKPATAGETVSAPCAVALRSNKERQTAASGDTKVPSDYTVVERARPSFLPPQL
jgi:hypothetical protein